MRNLILIAAMSALVLAKPKPETYRETEDFQYARSSSDDGNKSGFYGAQRGNMGGNFERAHNMDLLAQHQMSGLVKQVDGELGEGSKSRTGSVYTAANSRGIYGSGNYDLSNLQGRNFEEGESIGNSQSHSSLTSQNSRYRGDLYNGMNSAGFSSNSRQEQHSRSSGYQSLGYEDQRHIDNLQSVDTSQDLGRYRNDNNRYTKYSQLGTQRQSDFDQSSRNLHSSTNFDTNSQSRYITTPVRVVMRPGGRVAIPIAAPTYDVSRSSLNEDKNIINSDAEVLNQHTNLKPTSKVKHYESSYSYRKEWEKHHTQPAEASIVVATENPFPKNSELYEDTQLLQSAKNQFQNANLQTLHTNSDMNSQHTSNTKSAASSQSRFQSGFNSQQSQSDFNAQQSGISSDAYADAYGHRAQASGMTADLMNAATNSNLKPKSYHSSYSYHKSWERQGDPYVIKPAGGTYEDQSQRLTASSSNSAAYSSHQYGSHSRQAQHNYLADCDDESSHLRVPRSYNAAQELQQQQQGQDQWAALGQQMQNLEDFGQQQNKWDNLQELGQQTQMQWDNFQKSGQETQNQWDNIQELGQQTQDKYDKLEDFGQQSQRDLEQSQNEKLEDFNQHSQKDDVLPDFEQQMNGADIPEVQNSDTQKQNYPNNNIWDHTSGFNQPNIPNADDIIQQIQSVNRQYVNNKHTFEESDQSQTNLWYQNQDATLDKNIDSNNFMRPTSESKNNADQNFHQVENSSFNVNDKTNFFPSFSNNNNYHKHWHQNTDVPWNLNSDQNTNYGNNFWHTNEFNNFHNQHEHHFNLNHFSTTDNGQQIRNLWDKIDNIEGEISVPQSNVDDKHFSHDYSSFHSYNQNGYNWGGFPDYPKFESPQIDADKGNEDKHIEHHNLFKEETENTTTSTISVRPNNILPSHHSTSPPSHTGIPSLHSYNNKSSADEGRGDIGPEESFLETTEDNKPSKTAEEIEILSLTKEPHVIKNDEIVVSPNSITKDDNNMAGNLSNLNTQQRPNENSEHQLFSSLQSEASITTPIMQINTTPKINIIVDNDNHKPMLDDIKINKSSTDLPKQNPQKQTSNSMETLRQIEQQNLYQQSEDFGQQIQNSWLPNDNLQQSYDHQNVEQFEVFRQYDNDKLYKTPVEKIVPVNLSRESAVIKKADDTLQQTLLKTNDVDQGTQLSVIHSSNPENQNNQYLSVTTLQSTISTTIPTTEVTTKLESQDNLYSVNPSFGVTTLNTNVRTETNKLQNQNTENVERPEDVQQENLAQQFEDFGQQLQSSWFPSDNLQQGYDQQNMEPQFEVFHQNNKLDMQDETFINKDFGAEAPRPIHSIRNIPINSQQFQDMEISRVSNNYEQKFEPSVEPQKANRDFHGDTEPQYTSHTVFNHSDSTDNINPNNKYIQPQHPNIESLESESKSLTEASTEKPGFWESVGNKLTNAKNKVFSWFKS